MLHLKLCIINKNRKRLKLSKTVKHNYLKSKTSANLTFFICPYHTPTFKTKAENISSISKILWIFRSLQEKHVVVPLYLHKHKGVKLTFQSCIVKNYKIKIYTRLSVTWRTTMIEPDWQKFCNFACFRFLENIISNVH